MLNVLEWTGDDDVVAHLHSHLPHLSAAAAAVFQTHPVKIITFIYVDKNVPKKQEVRQFQIILSKHLRSRLQPWETAELHEAELKYHTKYQASTLLFKLMMLLSWRLDMEWHCESYLLMMMDATVMMSTVCRVKRSTRTTSSLSTEGLIVSMRHTHINSLLFRCPSLFSTEGMMKETDEDYVTWCYCEVWEM